MSIHPIEHRYGTLKMKKIWTQKSRLEYILKTEIALSKSEEDYNIIKKNTAKNIEVASKKVTLKRIKQIEIEINHETMAIIKAMTENCDSESGKWIHYGATSNDILDTALALQIKDGMSILEYKVKLFIGILMKLSFKYKKLVCCGRTHGQIAIPTTYGLKFGIWASEMDRHYDRLNEIKSRILVGQITGAVGTQSVFGDIGIDIQKKMMQYLCLNSVDISNQLIQRDRHSELVMIFANIATTLDKIFISIRTLQRSEISELEENFDEKNQVGSSTMPHKKNPIQSEQICGLSRIIRSYIEPELLNNTLWDERDLTNSSVERIIFPEIFILMDHILSKGINIFKNINLNIENINKNLQKMNGLNMSESMMISLTKKGIGRQKSHEIIRTISMNAYKSNESLYEISSKCEILKKYFKIEEIKEILNPNLYIGSSIKQVELLYEKLKRKYKFK